MKTKARMIASILVRGSKVCSGNVRRALVVLAIYLSVSHANAAFFMMVGDHHLQPGLAGQTIDLYFGNTDSIVEIAGLDFNIQVADGGPVGGGGILGPSITQVELQTGTVFSSVAATQVTAPSIDQVRVESITLNAGSVTVPVATEPNLLLATVTLDTSNFNTIGQTWSLSINNTLNGNSQFLDSSANPVAISSSVGSITIAAVPEPAHIGALTGICLIGCRVWMRRRKGRS